MTAKLIIEIDAADPMQAARAVDRIFGLNEYQPGFPLVDLFQEMLKCGVGIRVFQLDDGRIIGEARWREGDDD